MIDSLTTVRAQHSGTIVPILSRKLNPVSSAPNMNNMCWHDALLAEGTTSTPSNKRASPPRILAAAE